MLCLDVSLAEGIHRTFSLPESGRLSLGAAQDNDLVVPVHGVSRYHADVAIEPGRVRFIDRGSKNRLFAEYERHDEVSLGLDEMVGIGESRIWLRDRDRADLEVGYPIDQIPTAKAPFENPATTASLEPISPPAQVPKHQDLEVPPGMVLGGSPAVRAVLERIPRLLGSRDDILLRGETGTGKELFAQLIHLNEAGPQRPFKAINCLAIPAEMLEAELFGVERRAATGVEPRPGLFRAADGGTLLLDEISDLPLGLQGKFLRVLQEREVMPVGASRPLEVDVRVIATANCDLRQRVAEGQFRSDLYYRLYQDGLELPPLRERLEDLPALAAAFAARRASQLGRHLRGFSVGALQRLEAHAWPGNVRELEAVMKRTVSDCASDLLRSEHFLSLEDKPLSSLAMPSNASEQAEDSANIRASSGERGPGDDRATGEEPSLALKPQLEATERRALEQALGASNGNLTRAAQHLGISRQGLKDKLKRLGLEGRLGWKLGPPRESDPTAG
ncbi:MAG: sigma 54-interacting transcriptional regulator [Acidobacteriota bacterium]